MQPTRCSSSCPTVLALFVASVLANQISAAQRDELAVAPSLGPAQQTLSALRVPFVPNGGQWDSRAAFAAHTFAGTVFVTSEGEFVYSLPARRDPGTPAASCRRGRDTIAARVSEIDPACPEPSPAPSGSVPQKERRLSKSTGWVLIETLIDAKGDPLKLSRTVQKKAIGELPTEGRLSYHVGRNAATHANDLMSYEQVTLGEMYPGVNVHLRATAKNVEKIFTVAPQQDPAQIRIKLEGASSLEIGKQGELIAHTGNGPVAFTTPIAFQDVDGVRQSVAVQYALNSQTQEYGFSLGSFDRTRPLVIDPLLASTYLGGSDGEFAKAVAIHPHTGDIYVTGDVRSGSTNFPGLAGGANSTISGGVGDVFVSRFSGDLKRLIQSTLIGGNDDDSANAIAIHPGTGDIYVAGFTRSSSGFPGLSGAAQASYGGITDAFVSRLSADLKTLHRSSYIGGSGFDIANAVVIHPTTGVVYVSGSTLSSDLPGTLGGAQSTYGGSINVSDGDGFITALSADLSARLQSTYLGSASDEIASALAIHQATGDVYVAGWTSSTAFPIGGGAHAQATLNGSKDAFVVRLDSALTTMRGGTFLGGTSLEEATALALDPTSGDVIVAGWTASGATAPTLPGLVGAPQSTNGGSRDAFVSRLSRDLSSVLRSTYLGGSSIDQAFGVAVHPATGEIYVIGRTLSADFPGVAGGIQNAASGQYDAFVARLSADLRQRTQATYLGNAGSDEVRAIAIHPATGEVIVVGFSDANASPVFAASPATVLNGTATPLVYGGGYDAFVTRLSSDLTAINRTPNPFNFIHQSNVPPNTTRTSNEVQLVITPTPPDNQQTAYVSGAAGSEFCVTNTAGCCATPLPVCAGFASGWTTTPYQFLSGDRIAVRHTSANPGGTNETKLIIGGTAYLFRSSTGNANIACNLDMNGDNLLTSTVEGLILVRAMLGFSADAIIANTGVPAWDAVRRRLNEFCGTNFPFSASAFQ